MYGYPINIASMICRLQQCGCAVDYCKLAYGLSKIDVYAKKPIVPIVYPQKTYDKHYWQIQQAAQKMCCGTVPKCGCSS